MEFHKFLDAVTAIGAILMPVAAFIWKHFTTKMHTENKVAASLMHIENLKALNNINANVASLGAEIHQHVALDEVKHREFERRIDDLES